LISLNASFQAVHGSLKDLEAVLLFMDDILLRHVLFGYACEGELKLSDLLFLDVETKGLRQHAGRKGKSPIAITNVRSIHWIRIEKTQKENRPLRRLYSEEEDTEQANVPLLPPDFSTYDTLLHVLYTCWDMKNEECAKLQAGEKRSIERYLCRWIQGDLSAHNL